MQTAMVYAGLVIFTSWGALGQSETASSTFEVASVKTNSAGRAGGEGSDRESIASTPGGITMRNVSLRSAILWAYGMRAYQISGPAWLTTQKYDIVAKTSSAASEDQLQRMLQSLLADRFRLALHRETKELPVYLLAAGRRGARLQASNGEGTSSMRPAGGGLEFRNFPMSEFAERLSNRPFSVDRPVLDETGLTGRFDFTIKLADNAAELKRTLEGMERGGADYTAFLEPLGLRLQPTKGPVDVLVIDSAERAPIGN
jgi:uncharacterized protein (TIGR03435 family)